jgi:alpha-L-fucosidase
MMNNGFGDGTQYPVDYAWPADIMAIERWLPNSTAPFNPWREIEGKRYYLPAEVCDPIGREWFFTDADQARCDEELLGMFLTCRGRNTNLLLNVPPDRSGRIPEKFVEPLVRLRKNLDLLGFEI